MRAITHAASVILVSLALAGCARRPDASYRYKLTIAVETPEGIKTGSNVVELDYYKSWSGEPHRTYGQALALDLGASGMLVALLTQGRGQAWGDDDPKGIVFKNCDGGTRIGLSSIDVVRRIAACKAVYPVAVSDLPDILFFKDAKDPGSAAVVDPQNLDTVLGPGIVIRSATIQLTDEALTRGVDDHLPWVRSWRGKIDSPLLHTPEHIFNSVGRFDFIMEGEG